MQSWTARRAWHRLMYIHLVRAVLHEQGLSQHDLAQLLGIKDSFLSGLLAPPSALGRKRTPTPELATRLASVLCPDPARRDLLLYHLRAAREEPAVQAPRHSWLTPDEIGAALTTLEHLHETANFAAIPEEAQGACEQLWEHGQQVAARIDPQRHSLARVRALLYLLDAACMLDRADAALHWAREALLLLREAMVPPRDVAYRDWLLVNAARGETIALNNLGLAALARERAQRTAGLRGVQAEPTFWLPLVCADHLNALKKLPRFAISEAECVYERAAVLTQAQSIRQILLDNSLAEVYLAHGTRRSMRKALPLIIQGHALADTASFLGPLHRVKLLRTAARYLWQEGDRGEWTALMHRCLRLIHSAGLRHQLAQLRRSYGARVDSLLAEA